MNKRIAALVVGICLMATVAFAQVMNLNTVGARELSKIGIPIQQAALVVAYRAKIGRYKSFQQLYDVKGLKDAVIDQIREDANIVIK